MLNSFLAFLLTCLLSYLLTCLLATFSMAFYILAYFLDIFLFACLHAYVLTFLLPCLIAICLLLTCIHFLAFLLKPTYLFFLLLSFLLASLLLLSSAQTGLVEFWVRATHYYSGWVGGWVVAGGLVTHCNLIILPSSSPSWAELYFQFCPIPHPPGKSSRLNLSPSSRPRWLS